MTKKSSNKINVFGTGYNSMRFVLLHGSHISIQCYVSSEPPEEFMSNQINTVPIIPFINAEKYLREYYTVIASSEVVYWEIKDMLERLGLVEYEDFEYWETYRKKVAVIWGNCHSTAVKNMLRLSLQFTNEYGFYPVLPIQEQARLKRADKIEIGLNNCALFIHQCVRKENYFGEQYSSEKLIKSLPSECIIIGFPNLYRMPWFMFPQMASYADGKKWEGKSWFFRDRIIDQYHDCYSIKEIVLIMEDDSLFYAHEIQQREEAFYEVLMEREKEWDIKIARFIADNIQERHLFYDVGHPSGVVIKYIVEKMLLMLGMEHVLVSCPCFLEMDNYEIPVYKSVKKALGIRTEPGFIRRHNGRKLRDVDMDLEEYVTEYIMWTWGC